jgi:hypothetical protein
MALHCPQYGSNRYGLAIDKRQGMDGGVSCLGETAQNGQIIGTKIKLTSKNRPINGNPTLT